LYHISMQLFTSHFVQEIQTLSSTLPPFVYIYDPVSLRTTTTVFQKTLSDGPPELIHVHLDAVSCFSQKLLFDYILDSLPGLDPNERWNDSWDSFLHALRHVHRAPGHKDRDVPLVISVEQVDRLKPDAMVPLSRLRELVLSFLICLGINSVPLSESDQCHRRLYLTDPMAGCETCVGGFTRAVLYRYQTTDQVWYSIFLLLSFSSLMMDSRDDNDSVVQIRRNFRSSSSFVIQIRALLPPVFQSALWTLYLHDL